MGNNGVPAVIQKNDYYPFGLLMQERTDNASNKNKYLYNGKEFLPDNDLSWYDYGARMYDPQLGRWHVLDPASEVGCNWTPYRYAFNNPIRYLDSDGNFELDNAQQYKRLARYLEKGIADILCNNRIMAGLMGYGQLSYPQINNDVTWGKGPKIIIVDNLMCAGSSSFGCYNSSTPNNIYIEKRIVDLLEKASKEDFDAALLWVVQKILHEYIHYGDWTKDNKFQDFEAGEAFEDWVYGIDIQSLDDAKKLIELYNQRHKEQQNQQEQKDEENEKKKEGLQSLLSNFDSLEEGKYVWNGSAWVKQ